MAIQEPDAVDVIARWLTEREGFVFLEEHTWKARRPDATDLLRTLIDAGYTVNAKTPV